MSVLADYTFLFFGGFMMGKVLHSLQHQVFNLSVGVGVELFIGVALLAITAIRMTKRRAECAF